MEIKFLAIDSNSTFSKTGVLQKREFFYPILFLFLLLFLILILILFLTWFSQNKFRSHPLIENHGFTSAIIL